MIEYSLVELYFLRTLVIGRIKELNILLESERTNFAANEMLDIYQPILSKVDKEITERGKASIL